MSRSKKSHQIQLTENMGMRLVSVRGGERKKLNIFNFKEK
jgi:hypothetical protein